MHRFPVTVYYEDTDIGGIVYHANYLKFIERGRSAWVREVGVDQNALRAAGLVFAVREITATFLAPARLDEALMVETELAEVKGARFVMAQRVLRGSDVLFTARVTIVAMTLAGRAARLPREIRQSISGGAAGSDPPSA